jgi:pimeloyl-ACP methyl ester carboxylesterase
MLGRDALAVMDACGVSSAHFVGLSQGGMTGMWLAAHHPHRIQRLVLANTTAYIPVKDHWNALIETALKQGMEGIAEPTVTGWLSAQFKSAQPQRAATLVQTMRAMSPAGYAGCCAVLRDVDLRADLARILAPTLVIAGIKDGERGAAAAAALASGINGARRFDIADAAHLSAVENPAAFNRALTEFLG